MKDLPGYFDFPRSREAFARGQKDARPEKFGGCYYRRRGRTTAHLTLLSFEDPVKAYEQLREFAGQGAKVQSLNYTSQEPLRVPTKNGPTEWVSYSFAGSLTKSGKTAQGLRRLSRAAVVVPAPSWVKTMAILNKWIEWAGERHFMVFKGHYKKWLEMYYEDPGPCQLIGVCANGELEGVFGWEVMDGVAQVTIAKHTPNMTGKMLWVAGLQAIKEKTVLCGSTADKLKADLGLEPNSSWMFDLKGK